MSFTAGEDLAAKGSADGIGTHPHRPVHLVRSADRVQTDDVGVRVERSADGGGAAEYDAVVGHHAADRVAPEYEGDLVVHAPADGVGADAENLERFRAGVAADGGGLLVDHQRVAAKGAADGV